MNLTLHILFLAVGALLAGVSVPLILGRVPPNGLYGFRTRKTMSSPDIWYPINKRMGWSMLLVGAAVTLTSLVTWLTGPSDPDLLGYVHLAVLGAALTLAIVDGVRALGRM